MSHQQSAFYGRNTGHHFSIYPKDAESTVKVLGLWSGKASGDSEGRWVLKGIKLTWFDGRTQQIYNHPVEGDEYAEYTFERNETADWGLRAGWRIDRLQFETSHGNLWGAGGYGGTLHAHVAKGNLIGFEGSSGWEIDYISLRYRSAPKADE
ncbi:hypothetical protein JDV02_004525 [Purpureocillium takamizusanense]|uniref:Jacalin-type lectin domain-containing protein n=1 Tax=Purpureocillium takamizusanense TaxID=2060973 RepID=A0A9Q8V9H7_9HYPO|nr:uncharacterized protein JDV02_004525 [Purpureocillium takamizusanense]UNI18245.1 hypothetical protein JDV02_004525 [Purpureocillium takamizusanense]